MLASSTVPQTVEGLQAEAQEVAEQLRERFPDLHEGLHVAAMLRARLRDTEQAEALWRKCVELAPNREQYRVNLAAIAMDRGNSQLAAEVLEPIAAAENASPDASHHLGLALTNLGRTDEAEQVLTKALEQHPQSAAHWLVLGQAQLKLGKVNDAETSLRKSLELGGRSPELFFALATACARLEKPEDAAKFREQFAELKATQPLSGRERFAVLSTADARQAAVTVMFEAAAVHAQQQDSLEAERLLLRALALEPGNAACCQALARIYREARMPAEERVVRERLVQIEPQDLSNYVALAQLAAQLGDGPAAEATLKLAISVEPNAAPLYAALAQFYIQEQKAPRARWYAQEAVRRSPTAEGYVLLASTCRLLQDEATAEAAMAKARELEAQSRKAPLRSSSTP